REVILDEIAMHDDDPDDVVHNLYAEKAWGSSALGRPIAGTVASIEALTRDQIVEYYRSTYRPQDIVVAAAGNVDHDDVVRQVATAFGGNDFLADADTVPSPPRRLAAHPTPPSFDGPEKRNQRRNHDEIRLWVDYLQPGRRSQWIVDDAGTRGGLEPSAPFVILGDLNSDPVDGDSWPGAIEQLLRHPRVQDPKPTSDGAVEAAETQGGANAGHGGEARYDTADFAEPTPGNLRVDYVLPARELQIASSAVYWPRQGEPGSELTGSHPFPTSDHRLVRVDLQVKA
ncbi:MAG: endonuclease/exonuclease/phosphatase family protein, partial [Brachybacterium paraconglomeratum]|nr:endonuclease/exonuclease/phosphatase family protein [Brachybacterium paraconglomeratum]